MEINASNSVIMWSPSFWHPLDKGEPLPHFPMTHAWGTVCCVLWAPSQDTITWRIFWVQNSSTPSCQLSTVTLFCCWPPAKATWGLLLCWEFSFPGLWASQQQHIWPLQVLAKVVRTVFLGLWSGWTLVCPVLHLSFCVQIPCKPTPCDLPGSCQYLLGLLQHFLSGYQCPHSSSVYLQLGHTWT
jgi:hypothetical protein